MRCINKEYKSFAKQYMSMLRMKLLFQSIRITNVPALEWYTTPWIWLRQPSCQLQLADYIIYIIYVPASDNIPRKWGLDCFSLLSSYLSGKLCSLLEVLKCLLSTKRTYCHRENLFLFYSKGLQHSDASKNAPLSENLCLYTTDYNTNTIPHYVSDF